MSRLTRKYLSALGIESDKVDEIIEAHMETVNALKTELDEAKSGNDEADKAKKENEALKAELKELKDSAGKEDSYKVKYEALKEDFDKFKSDIKSEKTKAQKADAYKKLLSEAGVSQKRIEAVMKVSEASISKLELEEDGSVKDADNLKKAIKEEWEDFIETKGTEGARNYNPPKNEGNGGTKTKEEIMAIKDASERQKAILENKEMFGI